MRSVCQAIILGNGLCAVLSPYVHFSKIPYIDYLHIFFVFLERSPFKLIFQFYLNFLWFWRLLNILQLGFSFAERKFTSRHLYNFISYFNIWIQMQCDSIRTKYKPRLASLSNYYRAYKILMASVTTAITSLLITSLIDYLYLICFTSLS